MHAGETMGSPPNEAIHGFVARYRRLARQSWKDPPLGRLPEDARQSEERGLNRGSHHWQLHSFVKGELGPRSIRTRHASLRCSHAGPMLAGDGQSESYSLSALL